MGLELDWTKFFNRFEIRIDWAKDWAMFFFFFFFNYRCKKKLIIALALLELDWTRAGFVIKIQTD